MESVSLLLLLREEKVTQTPKAEPKTGTSLQYPNPLRTGLLGGCMCSPAPLKKKKKKGYTDFTAEGEQVVCGLDEKTSTFPSSWNLKRFSKPHVVR